MFLRELISNANDALEKLRLTSLTEKQVLDGAENLNITVKAVKDENGPGRIIITGAFYYTARTRSFGTNDGPPQTLVLE